MITTSTLVLAKDGQSSVSGMESPFLTRKQTASVLNVSEKWLAQSGRSSGPRFHKFGGHCRYHVDDVNNWVRQQRVAR